MATTRIAPSHPIDHAALKEPDVPFFLLAGAVPGAFGAMTHPWKAPAARVVRPLALLGMLAPWAYVLVLRPWVKHWGATEEEVYCPMSGDDEIPDANCNTTRAVTIKAPAEAVWPWLVQMGQGRAGLYSYDWIENVGGLNFHSADHIIPQLQDLQVGDKIPLEPSGQVAYRVAELEPNQLLLLTSRDANAPGGALKADEFASTWVFALHEAGHGRTRLIVRWRAHYHPGRSLDMGSVAKSIGRAPRQAISVLVVSLLIGPGQFVMERRMLLGIKERAERLAGKHAARTAMA